MQVSDDGFKLHLLDATTSFLLHWQSGVRAAAEAAGSSAASRHSLHQKRRQLLAQCAERLAEYRHFCHSAAGASAAPAGGPDLATRVERALDTLEVSSHLCACSIRFLIIVRVCVFTGGSTRVN